MPAVPKYRSHLPQLTGKLFLTDGGIETSLIYLQGFDLPYFAAFKLLSDDAGIEGLRREASDVLNRFRPATLGQAARLPGVTPAAVALLLVHLKRHGGLRRAG